MPEPGLIINGPDAENTLGPERKKSEYDVDSENNSLTRDSRNIPEVMGFEEKEKVKKH